jgi:hypothetical protein
LTGAGWQREQRVVDELGLKCDFEKNGIWVEVEFGNARSYYQDYVKSCWQRNTEMLGLDCFFARQ